MQAKNRALLHEDALEDRIDHHVHKRDAQKEPILTSALL
jgi:hypothetical protein